MDERDMWCILGILGLLAIGNILKTRMLADHEQRICEHDDDIEFLKSALKAMDERVD